MRSSPAYQEIPHSEAVALLRQAHFVHLAATLPDGRPMLRSLHAVVLGDQLAFHGSPRGEKAGALHGQAVVSYEQVLAELPSYAFDSERACPATTWYRSVQVHGVLRPVEDLERKAAVLDALMLRFQPEGGYQPITRNHPLYQKAVRGVAISELPLSGVVGKLKLGQNRRPEQLQAALQAIWQRGATGDAASIERLRKLLPHAPTPAFLDGGPHHRLHCALAEPDIQAASQLLAGAYWNSDRDQYQIAAGLRGSSAVVAARCLQTGDLVGVARAISDGSSRAWLYDVLVAQQARGKGLGTRLTRLLLDHPAVRRVQQVLLTTKDADGFYRRFGFAEIGRSTFRDWPSITMLRRLPGVA